MIQSDSQVVDALHDEVNLERVLRALGCDPGADVKDGGLISCPMPDHPDKNPSCVVRAKQGLFACQSLCDVILPADLVIAHGKANDRAGAMKWLEKTLGLTPRALPPIVPTVDDPSLTVAQYLSLKGLPPETAEKFGLEDVRIWQAGAEKGTKHCSYVTDWYNAVFMPNRSGRRPRVRSSAPGVKVKWAPKVRFIDGRFEDFTEDSSDPDVYRNPQDVIGLDQLRPAAPEHSPTLIIVEGESDVHALHAMGLPFCIGLPGSQTARKRAKDMLHAAIKANHGDTDLSELTVVVWQEPGSAGAKFPKDVAQFLADAALEEGFPAPRFATLHHTQVPTAPKDPCALLLDRPLDLARRQITEAITAALPQAGTAAAISGARACCLIRCRRAGRLKLSRCPRTWWAKLRRGRAARLLSGMRSTSLRRQRPRRIWRLSASRGLRASSFARLRAGRWRRSTRKATLSLSRSAPLS
jgi:hypothetical protein